MSTFLFQLFLSCARCRVTSSWLAKRASCNYPNWTSCGRITHRSSIRPPRGLWPVPEKALYTPRRHTHSGPCMPVCNYDSGSVFTNVAQDSPRAFRVAGSIQRGKTVPGYMNRSTCRRPWVMYRYHIYRDRHDSGLLGFVRKWKTPAFRGKSVPLS